VEGTLRHNYLPDKPLREKTLATIIPARIAETDVSGSCGRASAMTKMPGEKEIAMEGATMFAATVDLEEMGRRMDRARAEAGMSVFQLVVAAEINETQIRKYLKGQTEPGATKLARIAEVLGVSADWLLQNTDDPSPKGKWDGQTERRSNPPTSGGSSPGDLPVPRKRQARRRSA
jgi:transcriptional regulator with XRE-family HTH domain